MRQESPSPEHAAEQHGGDGGGGGVKRRPLHQHQQQQQQQRHSPLLPHHESGASLGGGDKKRATSYLERRIVFLRRLFRQQQPPYSRARLLAWSILITFMLVPIVIFHALPLSSSSSSFASSISSSSSWWPLGHIVGTNRRIVEPRVGSLYGRHYRAVKLDDDSGEEVNVAGRHHVVRLETFRSSDQHQSTGNTHEEITTSTSSSGATAAALQKFDLQNITEPRVFRATTALKEEDTPNTSSNENNANNNNNDNNARRRRHYRLVQPMIAKEKVKALQDSSAYNDAQPDNWETKRCRAQFAWQKATYMTCNVHHELDMNVFSSSVHKNDNVNNRQHQLEADENNNESLRLVANGYYRDVWVVRNDYDDAKNVISSSNATNSNNSSDKKIVLKTLRYEHEFDLRNWDRHRRDAIAMERLTSSRFVLDVYASCGNSGLTEYAPGGSIKNALFPPRPRRPRRTKQLEQQQGENVKPPQQQQQQLKEQKKPSKIERLQMAVQATMGLQALHFVGMGTEGSFGPAVAHTDISPDQFVRVGDIYKLNDFNRARFIRVDSKAGSPCSFKISQASGLFRSPEEYDKQALTEKIDIYSLGNLFYLLLTDQWPWDEVGSESEDSERSVKKRIIRGERPAFPDEIAYSSHPVDVVLRKAMAMCQKHEPSERATAAQVATLLQVTLQQVDPGRLEQWGVVVSTK